MHRDDVPFAVMLSVFVGGLAGFLIAAKLESQITKDAWDIVSALGTAGAVVAAVWVSFKSSREQKRHRQAKGLLTGVLLHSSLESLLDDVNFMRSQLAQYPQKDMEPAYDYYRSPVFSPLRHPALELINPDTLDLISGLSDDVALHLSYAASSLTATRTQVEEIAAEGRWPRLSEGLRQEVVRMCMVAGLEAAISVGYAWHRLRELLEADRIRALRQAHGLYTRKQMGPPIKLDDVLGRT